MSQQLFKGMSSLLQHGAGYAVDGCVVRCRGSTAVPAPRSQARGITALALTLSMTTETDASTHYLWPLCRDFGLWRQMHAGMTVIAPRPMQAFVKRGITRMMRSIGQRRTCRGGVYEVLWRPLILPFDAIGAVRGAARRARRLLDAAFGQSCMAPAHVAFTIRCQARIMREAHESRGSAVGRAPRACSALCIRLSRSSC